MDHQHKQFLKPRSPQHPLQATHRRFFRRQDVIIYGTTLLALCHLAGLFLGDLLGQAIGVKANVGGVGIAMLLLICARLYLHRRGLMPVATEAGVSFWGAMYIPVVVAMAATQNVVAALRGGPVALLAAAGSVLVCACFVSLINRTERNVPEAEAKAHAAPHRA
jgi:malonate transporter MadL subunit